jgi:alkylhydroperoxidase family enzyme
MSILERDPARTADYVSATEGHIQTALIGDTQMFELLARRPELLKRAAAMFAYFPGGEGGLIEPELLELMRHRGANLNACTYGATVRLQPVASAVKPKEAALGLRDISGMIKPQAVSALKDTLKRDKLSPREAAAITLVDRIIVDPHGVDAKRLPNCGSTSARKRSSNGSPPTACSLGQGRSTLHCALRPEPTALTATSWHTLAETLDSNRMARPSKDDPLRW